MPLIKKKNKQNFSCYIKLSNLPNPKTPRNQSEQSAAYLASKHQRQSVVGAGNFAVAQQRGALWAFYYGRHSRDDQQKKKKRESGRMDFAVAQILGRKTSGWSRGERERGTESFKKDSRFMRERDCIRAFAHTCTETQSTPPHPPPSTPRSH